MSIRGTRSCVLTSSKGEVEAGEGREHKAVDIVERSLEKGSLQPCIQELRSSSSSVLCVRLRHESFPRFVEITIIDNHSIIQLGKAHRYGKPRQRSRSAICRDRRDGHRLSRKLPCVLRGCPYGLPREASLSLREDRGRSLFVTGVDLRSFYGAPCAYGDTIVVYTRVTKLTPVRVEYSARIYLKGRTSATRASPVSARMTLRR